MMTSLCDCIDDSLCVYIGLWVLSIFKLNDYYIAVFLFICMA